MTRTDKKVLTAIPRPSLPSDLTLQQEIRSLGNDDGLEFMNLTSRQTGIDGIVFISTAMGQHGPRVKYFAKAGKDQPSFSVSISGEPRVLANSLPDHVLNRMSPAVIEWVVLNSAELLSFWEDGTSWTYDEERAFVARLRKLSGDQD